MENTEAEIAFMRRAIALSERAIAENAGPPFGAVIARGDRLLAEGFNQSRTQNDPTAHGEIVAIRLACDTRCLIC